MQRSLSAVCAAGLLLCAVACTPKQEGGSTQGSPTGQNTTVAVKQAPVPAATNAALTNANGSRVRGEDWRPYTSNGSDNGTDLTNDAPDTGTVTRVRTRGPEDWPVR